MTDAELSAFAADWILYWKSPEGSVARESLNWVGEREWDLINDDAQLGWRFVLAVNEMDSSPEIQEVLAAGPLEDLLSKHGAVVIEAVESEARRNPLFAQLLGGVWQNRMPETIWSRVRAVWNRSGWDGNP
jgi:hypothetical protein